jgi:hypothetical protein
VNFDGVIWHDSNHCEVIALRLSTELIEASLDAARTPYTAIIVPGAEHNLTVRPDESGPFFWWKSAPGLIDLVVAWLQQRTA